MPALILAGDDLYSMGRAVEHIRKAGEFQSIDVSRIDARSTPRQSMLMTIGTQGLFAQNRLIILDGLGHEPGGRGRAKKKTAGEDDPLTVGDLIAVLPEATTLVILLTGLRADSVVIKEATRLAKDNEVKLRMFPVPKPKDMAGWLANHAQREKIRLEPSAARQLAQRVGDQVSIAGMELQKLATAAGPDGVVTAELVQNLVAQTAEESIFPLVDAIAARQANRAFQLLGGQLDQIHGNEAEVSLPLIRLLARQFRILLQIRRLSREGKKRPEIISDLKLSEYFADKYFTQAARFSEVQIAQAQEDLAATEQAMKNGEAGPAAIQLLTASLTAQPARAHG